MMGSWDGDHKMYLYYRSYDTAGEEAEYKNREFTQDWDSFIVRAELKEMYKVKCGGGGTQD